MGNLKELIYLVVVSALLLTLLVLTAVGVWYARKSIIKEAIKKNNISQAILASAMVFTLTITSLAAVVSLSQDKVIPDAKAYIKRERQNKLADEDFKLYNKKYEEEKELITKEKKNQIYNLAKYDYNTKVKEVVKLQDNKDVDWNEKFCEDGWVGCYSPYNVYTGLPIQARQSISKEENRDNRLLYIGHNIVVDDVDVKDENVVIHISNKEYDDTQDIGKNMINIFPSHYDYDIDVSKEDINMFALNLISDLRVHNVDVENIEIIADNDISLKIDSSDIKNINIADVNYKTADTDNVFVYSSFNGNHLVDNSK